MPDTLRCEEALPLMLSWRQSAPREDVEDAVQNVCLRALRQGRHPKAYWRAAVRNALIDQYRRNDRRLEAETEFGRAMMGEPDRDALVDACATPSGRRLVLDELGLRKMSRRARCYHRKRVRRD